VPRKKIRQAGIAFRIPERAELRGRLEAVLDAIYAAFAEAWSDPGGTDVANRNLTEREPEAQGLLALMLHAEGRRRARRGPGGEFVPLAEQDQQLWDWQMILEAESLLRRSSTLGPVGRFQLEAALQSAHVYRCRTGNANWQEVAELYDALFALTESPVVAINRSLAMAETQGPAAALAAMPDSADARLTSYQPYWAARAELLAKTGAHKDAWDAYEIAIGLERDPAVRSFLQKRQSERKA
jgi:predicted RNA polymerase sigma factor